jgi:hypothetical protein
MNYVTENITPAKAREYLDTMVCNRPISKAFVHSYADTMKRGKWLLNGMCIIFDNEGHLIDGGHRLHAVIEAGIPVRFDVIRGVDPQSFTTYDCGRHRTVGQLLAMQDVKNYNLVAAIVVANQNIINSGRLSASNTTIRRGGLDLSNASKYDLFRLDPEGFTNVGFYINKLLSRCRILSGSWAGGMFYYLTHRGGYTEDEVKPFFEDLYTLETSEIPACNVLRKTITKAAMAGQKIKAETLWSYIAKAWNSYITGKELKLLRYNHGKEEVPKLIIKQQ